MLIIKKTVKIVCVLACHKSKINAGKRVQRKTTSLRIMLRHWCTHLRSAMRSNCEQVCDDCDKKPEERGRE